MSLNMSGSSSRPETGRAWIDSRIEMMPSSTERKTGNQLVVARVGLLRSFRCTFHCVGGAGVSVSAVALCPRLSSSVSS